MADKFLYETLDSAFELGFLKKEIHDYVFIDEEGFEKFKPKSFEEVIKTFTKYKT